MKLFLNKAKEYLSFSKSEQKGIIVLFVLMVLIIASPGIYRKFFPVKPYNYLDLKNEAAEFKKGKSDIVSDKKLQADELSFFTFDPNTVTAAEMNQLGFSPVAMKSVMNYRSKNGRFRQREDLKKMFGMSAGFYEKIESFIVIESSKKNEYSGCLSGKTMQPVEINSADSASLISLRGIGPVLAKRILKYRDKLGGFYSLNQLREVYGLSDSLIIQLVKMLMVDTTRIKLLPINRITEKELADHPYVSVYQARGLLNFRKLEGDFKNIRELRESKILPDSLISRLLPYIAF